ncbi:glycosyltransferase family 2 protein [Hymenobacter psychrotolerans]|uniref:Glycosyltransferase involved in cell wall bisynthesis n=1 Tax=Hymenobacter psychrotolerans DSM 18569 TaxID=1121959 RepID=A0A1M7BHX9_9BACT|nr:glycosyltransferase family A protein [Hymenobacter psychrotolerans]SHL54229.1 Glycosyltransferase involved in cell wall bisynthesis [Hymenobacter psychrotolerans DSM 18569]
METTPFFSIVIPTYNRAGFIADTLRSVLAQTFTELEIIVVDDGSKDETATVVERFTDPRVQYMPKANGERGAARNYGLARARGEYVLFLDSDDLFHPTHLATLHAKIVELQPNFIATKYDFNRDGVRAESDMAGLSEGWYGLDLFVRGNALACNICVRRENPGLRPFEEDRRYAAVEDWMFMLENMQQDRVYIVDAVTLTMNDHDTRSMRSDNTALVRKLQLALEWMLARVRLTELQQRILTGRVYYLCAIHAYADNHRREALQFAQQAAPHLPAKQAAVLLVRCLIGLRAVEWLKKLRA